MARRALKSDSCGVRRRVAQAGARQRVVRRGVGDHLRKVDAQHRVGGNLDGRLRGEDSHEARQKDKAKEKEEKGPHQNSKQAGQKGLEEIHVPYVFLRIIPPFFGTKIQIFLKNK